MQTFKELQESFKFFCQNNNFNKKPIGLYEPIDYILGIGGKRIRPVLLLMAYDLFKNNLSEALPAAFAIEIFHNFSLVHDDIMDEAPLRRGKATVHKKYNVNTSILSGDAMLIYAYDFILRTGSNRLPGLLATFNKAAIEVCEGQQFDMDFEQRNDVSIEEYLNMIRLKTAVLLGASLKMGGILGDCSKTDEEHLYKFGENIGIAFQLQDDILDTFGDPEKFGKKVGGDIVQNKKTFLVLKTLEVANDSDKNKLETLMNGSKMAENAKIEAVKEIFNNWNIRQLSDDLKQEYMDKAFQHLSDISVDEDKKKGLKKLALNLMGREH